MANFHLPRLRAWHNASGENLILQDGHLVYIQGVSFWYFDPRFTPLYFFSPFNYRRTSSFAFAENIRPFHFVLVCFFFLPVSAGSPFLDVTG
jgi:hypothetical protein